MGDQAKNMMIGIFVIAAFAIIIFIMMFLHPNIGNEGKALRVRFADIDKINIGTRVNYAGKPVGEVVDIYPIPTPDERIEYDGIIYVYELKLLIDSGVNVYTIDEVSSRTSGLLGEKSVGITPTAPKPGEKLILVTDQILYATEVGGVEQALSELRTLGTKIETAMNSINEILNNIKEQQIVDHLGNAFKNIDEITGALNQPEKLKGAVNDMVETMKSAKDISAALNQPEHLSNTVKNIADAAQSAKDITGTISGGKGTLGQLVMKDETYLRLNALFSKAEIILDDINHYGILFQTDKAWQRLRARRLNLMQKLSTPQEFRNFFNDEIDDISTSLSRVHMVLEKSEDECPCALWWNPEYAKVYSELLRRVKALEENVQMYNQQVEECKVQQTELVDEVWYEN